MSARSDKWSVIFETPTADRNFDDGNVPWLLNPRTHDSDDRAVQVMAFTSSLLIAIGELAGTASLIGWDLADGAQREKLWQHVREIGQLLATLKVGLVEHENEQENPQ